MLATIDGKEENWATDAECNFVDYADDMKAPELKDNELPCWLIPVKWNQGCFDIVYVADRANVRLVQVTISDAHSLDWSYVATLMKWLRGTNKASTNKASVVYATLKPPTRKQRVRLSESKTWHKPKWNIQIKHYNTKARSFW